MNESVRSEGISHVAIVVTELERSVAFYSDVLGLRRLGQAFTVDDDASAALWGLDRARGRHRVAILRSGDALVTLVRFDEGAVAQRAAPAEDVGLSHFGLWVSSVDTLYDELSAVGVKFITPPYTTPFVDVYGGPMRVARLLDPDGTAIEVYNVLES